MSKSQLHQAHVLRKYNEGLLDRKATASALRLSERQITRLAKGMKEEGETALIHKNTGRKPANAMTAERKAQIVAIRQTADYDACNVRHFQELLEREHRIRISYSALYGLLREAGIQSPKQHKKHTSAHRRRKRKPSAGELQQIDATPYPWFGDGVSYALHGAIDDATGMITGLYMTQNECLQGYLEVMRHMITGFGVPLSVYSDQHTIFRSPATARKAENGEDANLTQFGRALAELGINIIHAHSPQAKGRIERAWATLQSRLPVEFRRQGITSMETANVFLAETFIPLFNTRFAVEAESAPLFIPYTHSEGLDDILCVKEQRKTDNAGCFSFRNQAFKVLDEGYPLIPAKASIEVLVSVRCSVRVRYKGRVFATAACEKAKPQKDVKKLRNTATADVSVRVKPHLVHGSDEWKRVWHHQDYAESLAFLYDLFLKTSA